MDKLPISFLYFMEISDSYERISVEILNFFHEKIIIVRLSFWRIGLQARCFQSTLFVAAIAASCSPGFQASLFQVFLRCCSPRFKWATPSPSALRNPGTHKKYLPNIAALLSYCQVRFFVVNFEKVPEGLFCR